MAELFFTEFEHPRGPRLRIHSDRLEIWAPLMIKPPWWAFWRKPTEQMRPVAMANVEVRAGDTVTLGLAALDGAVAKINDDVVLSWNPHQRHGFGIRP